MEKTNDGYQFVLQQGENAALQQHYQDGLSNETGLNSAPTGGFSNTLAGVGSAGNDYAAIAMGCSYGVVETAQSLYNLVQSVA